MKKSKQDNSKTEYGGYKIGDVVFCKRLPDNDLGHGEIRIIHISESSPPCFTFGCTMTGAFRLAFFDDIIDNPTEQQIRKAKKANATLYKPRKKK